MANKREQSWSAGVVPLQTQPQAVVDNEWLATQPKEQQASFIPEARMTPNYAGDDNTNLYHYRARSRRINRPTDIIDPPRIIEEQQMTTERLPDWAIKELIADKDFKWDIKKTPLNSLNNAGTGIAKGLLNIMNNGMQNELIKSRVRQIAGDTRKPDNIKNRIDQLNKGEVNKISDEDYKKLSFGEKFGKALENVSYALVGNGGDKGLIGKNDYSIVRPLTEAEKAAAKAQAYSQSLIDGFTIARTKNLNSAAAKNNAAIDPETGLLIQKDNNFYLNQPVASTGANKKTTKSTATLQSVGK